MKKLSSLMFVLLAANALIAQNTFPGTGNAGIGTITPAYNLDITSPSTTTLQIASTLSTANTSIIFGANGGSNNGLWKIVKSPSNTSGLLTWYYNTGIYGGDRQMMSFLYNSSSGAVVIGAFNSIAGSCALAVDGEIGARSLVISNLSPFPDYVFATGYKLLSLAETEKYIKQHAHLPEMPSAAEVKKEGFEVGRITTGLLQKVEELTLLMIEMNKKIERLEKENKKLNAEK